MRILITGADTPLGRLLAHRLGSHELRLASSDTDFRTPEVAEPLVEGIDAVAHLAVYPRANPASPAEEKALLDHAARGTYVLQQAALKAGVERIVLASRLELLTSYPAELVIDETWQPQPEANAASLAPYMAELTLREFARAEAISAVCLRLGPLEEEAPWTAPETATEALERALTMELPAGYRWRLYHVDSSGRFPAGAAGEEPLSLQVGRG